MEAAASSSIADEVRSTTSFDDSFIASALDSTGSNNGGIGPTSNASAGEEKKSNHGNMRSVNGGGGGGGLDNDDISGIGDDPGTPTQQMPRRFADVDDHLNSYNPIGMTIGDYEWQLASPTSPTSMNLPDSNMDMTRSPVVRATSTTTYGRVNQSHAIHSSVHMHVQENAKISTYNQPVDRSNSTSLKGTNNSSSINNKRRRLASGSVVGGGGGHYSSSGIAEPSNNNNNNSINNGEANGHAMVNGTHNHNDDDDGIDNNSLLGESMAEIFLSKESTNRRSRELNYQIFGSLPADVRFENRRRYSGGDGGGSGSGLGGSGGNAIGNIDEETQMEMDALTAAIDPTPWSEIEGKINADVRNERMKQQQQQQQQQSYSTMGSSDPIQENHPHQSSYYPYGRHYQLPIPGKPASPPPVQATAAAAAAAVATAGVGGMADALATAAALAVATGAEAGTSTGGTGASSNPVNINEPHTGQSQPATTKTSAASMTAPISSRHTYQRYRADSSTVQPHATSKASVLDAANKKSQYGFGGDHTVPSVPAPPQWKVNNSMQVSSNAGYHKRGIATSTGPTKLAMRTSTSAGRSTAAPSSTIPPKLPTHMQQESAASKAATTASSILSNKTPASTSSKPLTDQSMTYTQSNSGAAYERKKQRAKDARVKLNESIERLSIAMSLAGTQSKQRVDQFKSDSLMTTDVRQKTIQINEQCAKLADQAKKWDRPSFVGTAASIIQSLNAQCESLMLELYAMQSMVSTTEANQEQQIQQPQQNQQQELSIDTTTNGNATTGEDKQQPTTYPPLIDTSTESIATENGKLSSSPTSHPEQKRHDHPTEEDVSKSSGTKRQRCLEPDGQQSQISLNGTDLEGNSAENQRIIFHAVSKFLDPVSLCRCKNVSKNWNELDGFANNDLWLSLSVKRFGFFNVRQWNEKLEDVENEEGKVPSVRLYKEMNSANVMPHVSHEGMTLLGESMIPGRASGWVFLVERSNGETLRSVRRQPGPDGGPGTGSMYQSLPVVELRIMIQNTGMGSQPVVLNNQTIAVDVSTRRSGGELKEIDWDDRFKKVVRNLDGSPRRLPNDAANTTISQAAGGCDVICKLDLFETAVIEVHLHARGCTTTSKFQQRSNFTKLLVTLDGTTVPMVIPFLRDHHHGVH